MANWTLDDKIISYVRTRIFQEGGHAIIPLRDIADATGGSLSSVWTHIQRLIGAGRIVRHGMSTNCYHEAK